MPLLENLAKLGLSPSDEEIKSCADQIQSYFNNIIEKAEEDLEDAIAREYANFNEVHRLIFKKVFNYVNKNSINYSNVIFDGLNSHFTKSTPSNKYQENDGRIFDEIDVGGAMAETEVDKIDTAYKELYFIWLDYQESLQEEIDKQSSLHFQNHKQFRELLNKELAKFKGNTRHQKEARETAAKNFINDFMATARVENHPDYKIANEINQSLSRDMKLKLLHEKLEKVQQLMGYVDLSLRVNDPSKKLEALQTTKNDLNLPETKNLLGTHRTNKWLRRAYNLISLLFAGIAAAFRAAASYHKYGTVRFYLPKGAKVRIQAKDIIEAATKKIK